MGPPYYNIVGNEGFARETTARPMTPAENRPICERRYGWAYVRMCGSTCLLRAQQKKGRIGQSAARLSKYALGESMKGSANEVANGRKYTAGYRNAMNRKNNILYYTLD